MGNSTCGYCFRTWDYDTPAGRCPYEYDHDTPARDDEGDDALAKLDDVKRSMTLERDNAARKAREIKHRLRDNDVAYLNDPAFNYWSGQSAMAEMALSLIDAAERDL